MFLGQLIKVTDQYTKSLITCSGILSLFLLSSCAETPQVEISVDKQAISSFDNRSHMPSLPLPIIPAGSSSSVAPNFNPNQAAKYDKVNWDSLPGWKTDNLTETWYAFTQNCQAILRRPAATASSTWADPGIWTSTCKASLNVNSKNNNAIRQFLESQLQAWRLNTAQGGNLVGLVTGYYEPLVQASRTKGGKYQWPLFAVPDDLLTIDIGALYPELAGKRVRGKLDGKRVVPYDNREELTQTNRQPNAIVWVDDPVDAFFLQVQGSGRAQINGGADAGTVIRLAYADHNGHPYQSIGKWLVDQGELKLSDASMQNIRRWASQNPDKVQTMLNANPAVVFFQEETLSDAGEGPRGAFAVPLTAQRSIAVDPAWVPLGAPVFLATSLPGTKIEMNRLVFAQDTGAAIKGPGRADFYWGPGTAAGELAGKMKQAGTMWVLWPKNAKAAPR